MFREIAETKINESRKNGKNVELSVWKAIKNEFLMFTKAENAGELTDDAELKIIRKMANQRKDSIESYTIAFNSANTDESRNKIKAMLDNEIAECEMLESMLPKEPTVDDLKKEIKSIVDELIVMNGSISMRDMKNVQALVKQSYPTANGGKVAEIFKSFI